jgi:hypothetical protein
VTTRRQFIHTGVALAALPSASFAARFAAAQPAVLRLERFVVDGRFAAAAAVAGHMAERGVPVSAVAGDLTDLWYRELDLAWKRSPQPLAGMSTRQGLFVLETLAADHRMRVVYRGLHRTTADGRVSHAFAGPDELIARLGEESPAFAWSTLGVALTECPPAARLDATCELASAALPAPSRDEPLVSWIIAPRSAAVV